MLSKQYFLNIQSSKIKMGQENSRLVLKEQRGKKNQLKGGSTQNMRKKMSPLQYINPINFNFEEPSTPGDLEGETQNCETDAKGKEGFRNQLEGLEQQNIGGQQEQGTQIMYKKIAVKWNKFIKMKRKNFLSDYRVIREIGRGGFGCVYKVIMRNGNIYRAAKKINKSSLKTEQHQNLLAEMAIMMNMDHPNITKLYQVYDQQNHYVMILEFCDGGELFQRIIERSINQREAKIIIGQVLSVLHFMHSKGIVHRDIKPENMLFQKKTNLIKIIDFGISAKLQPNKPLNLRVGTPYYIAPQVLQKKYNQKCDIWSLGIVLYMIIYNNPPFKGDDAAKIMQSVAKDQVTYRNPKAFNFSNESIQFLKRLLVKNPKLRISAFQALNHKWLESYQKFEVTVKQDQKNRVLQRITKFHFKNKLQAVVYTYIVSQLLSSQERLQLHNIFKSLDKNNNGIIQVGQLKSAFQNKESFSLTDQKIKIIKDYLDTNCSGVIDYTQFLVGAMDFQNKVDQKHFSQAFSYFDIDNSGEITFQEVAKFLQDQITTQQEVRQLFKQVDKNGDGVISKIQFIQLLASKKLQNL